MKTKRFLLAAGLVLAMAFTLSCSDSGDKNPVNNPVVGPSGTPGGSVNLSELSGKQVYLVKENNNEISKIGESSDNGNVFLSVEYKISGEWTTDKIPAGKIKDGKITLDSLPTISSKYSSNFEKFLGLCEEEDEYYSSCESTLEYPKDLSIYWDAELTVDIPDKDCGIHPYIVKSDKWSGLHLLYFSKSGKITGTETFTSTYGGTGSDKWDMNVSEGWNYYIATEEENSTSYTSTIPAGATLEWGIECY